MRPINEREFQKSTGQASGSTRPAMALWQYHLIGRIDEIVYFKMDDLKGHARPVQLCLADY